MSEDVREDLLRHFPVAIVATILTAFLRLVIQFLGDRGSRFSERIDQFKQIQTRYGNRSRDELDPVLALRLRQSGMMTAARYA